MLNTQYSSITNTKPATESRTSSSSPSTTEQRSVEPSTSFVLGDGQMPCNINDNTLAHESKILSNQQFLMSPSKKYGLFLTKNARIYTTPMAKRCARKGTQNLNLCFENKSWQNKTNDRGLMKSKKLGGCFCFGSGNSILGLVHIVFSSGSLALLLGLCT